MSIFLHFIQFLQNYLLFYFMLMLYELSLLLKYNIQVNK